MLSSLTGIQVSFSTVSSGKSLLNCRTLNKEEDECENDFERWIYILKHMDTLDRMPFKARKAVFERLEKFGFQSKYDPGGKSPV